MHNLCVGFWNPDQKNDTSPSIGCYGAYSCLNATALIATKVSDDVSITCGGLFSCAFPENITMDGGSLQCLGERSCYNSTIRLSNQYYAASSTSPESEFDLCDGLLSCENSIIYVSDRIEAWGYLSMKNSKIYTFDRSISTKYFVFHGPESAYGAQIICSNNVTCNIECHVNACDNLTLLCENETSNNNNNDSNNTNTDTCTFAVTCKQSAWKHILIQIHFVRSVNK